MAICRYPSQQRLGSTAGPEGWGGEKNTPDARGGLCGRRRPHPWQGCCPFCLLGSWPGCCQGWLACGEGLVFSPLLLALGLEAHQALATSTMVPSRLRAPAVGGSLGIGGGLIAALLFSSMGRLLQGWQLLALQSVM